MGKEKEILVTPDYLRKTAQNISEYLRKGSSGYEEIEECALQTKSCLKGKCADRIREKLIKQKEKGMRSMEELGSFPQKLLQIAAEYEAAEKENKK